MVLHYSNIGSLLLFFSMITIQAMDGDDTETRKKLLGHRRNRSFTINVEGGVKTLEELLSGADSKQKLAAIKQLLDSVALQMGDVQRDDSPGDQVTITVRRPFCSWQSALRWGIGATVLAGAGVGVWYATQSFNDAKAECNDLGKDAKQVVNDFKQFMPMLTELQQIISSCPSAGKLQLLKGFETCCKGN